MTVLKHAKTMCEFLHNLCRLGGSFARGRPSLAIYII